MTRTPRWGTSGCCSAATPRSCPTRYAYTTVLRWREHRLRHATTRASTATGTATATRSTARATSIPTTPATSDLPPRSMSVARRPSTRRRATLFVDKTLQYRTAAARRLREPDPVLAPRCCSRRTGCRTSRPTSTARRSPRPSCRRSRPTRHPLWTPLRDYTDGAGSRARSGNGGGRARLAEQPPLQRRAAHRPRLPERDVVRQCQHRQLRRHGAVERQPPDQPLRQQLHLERDRLPRSARRSCTRRTAAR